MDLRLIIISIFFSTTFIVQSHNSEALDPLVEHYSNKNIISDIKVDLDGDGKLDYVAIYEEPLANDSNETVKTNLVTLLSSEDYKEFILNDFLPSQKKSRGATNPDVYTLTSVNRIKNGIRIIISKGNEKLSTYRRIITFKYDKKERTLVAVKDGGVGVFGETEKYVDVNKFIGERITLKNWSEWYSSLMCSSPSSLNNRLVFVNNESEFINSVSNNTTIIVKAKRLNLSLSKISEIEIKDKINSAVKFGSISKDMGIAYADSAWWIEGVTNMSVIGSSTQLVSTSSKEYILWLNNCKNIELSNVSIFHDLSDSNSGNGWNMCLSNSSNVKIAYSLFKKDGGAGLFVFNSENIYVNHSIFEGLRNFAILARKSVNLNFANCNFINNQSIIIQLDNAIAFVNNCNLYNNIYYYIAFLSEVDLRKSYLSFTNCREYDNAKLYDIGAKLGYSYFYGLSDLDESMDINSGNVVINF